MIDNWTKGYSAREGKRYWWWHIDGVDHDPLINLILGDHGNRLLEEWYQETHEKRLIGECAPTLGSLLIGFVIGNSLERIVQLGHYSGYSTITIGACLNRMRRGKLFSIDIKQNVTDFTQGWIERFGFNDHVELACADSASQAMVEAARASLGGAPDLVFIDSSHKYAHTLAELDLWYPALRQNGFILLHDASNKAREYDVEHGAVAGALEDWCGRNGIEYFVLNGGGATPAKSHADLVYRDGCGLGIIQKRAPRA